MVLSWYRKYSPQSRFLPANDGDVRVFARFEQACSVEQSYFAAAAETIGTELVIRPYVYSYNKIFSNRGDCTEGDI